MSAATRAVSKEIAALYEAEMPLADTPTPELTSAIRILLTQDPYKFRELIEHFDAELRRRAAVTTLAAAPAGAAPASAAPAGPGHPAPSQAATT